MSTYKPPVQTPNSSKKVVIVRGLPGSGKSTYVRQAVEEQGGLVCSPDLFFYQTGEYCFVKSRIGEAHAWCRVQYLQALAVGEPLIYLDYPFVERWQYEDYEWMAKVAGYDLEILVMGHEASNVSDFAARNTHGVPIEVIKGMAKKWYSDPRAQVVDQDWFSLEVGASVVGSAST